HVVTVTSTDPSTGSTSTHTYDPATDQHTDSVRSTDAQTGLTTTTNADSISGSTFTVTDPAGHVLLQATGEPQVKVDPQTGATSIDTHDPVNDEVTHHQISTGPGGVTVVSSADPTNGSTYSVSDPHTGHLIQQGTGDPLVTTAPDGRIQVGSYDPGKQIGTTTLFDPRTGATSTTTFDLAHSQATSVHQEQVDEPGGYHTTITSDPRGGTTYVVRDQGGTVVAWGSGNPTVAVDPASGRVTVTDPSSQPLPPATDLADPPAAHPAGTAPPDTTKDPAPAEPAHPAHPQDPTPAPTGPDAMVHSLTQPGVTVVPADQTYTLLHQVAPDLVGADATAGGFKLGPPQLSGGQVTVPTEIGNATASVGASPDGHLAVQITGVPTLAPISTGDANAALRPQLDAFNAQLDKAGLKVTGVTVDHGQIVITKAPR
ncbi:MAG TPA: hypothetical protein VG245_02215, partial [Candidatus Dormibacteraeota bacterium]|nr:hypothetical protein [Candidatus Dormibacteraeota bacterium]